MRVFAVDYLSDLMGAEFQKLEAVQVQSFASFVAFVICREVQLHERIDSLSASNLIKDGHLTNEAAQEHLIQIKLSFTDFEDSFSWDISEPNNDPFEFAEATVRDCHLPPFYVTRIAHEIQRQV